MKKLTVMIMVLVIASVATAGLDLSWNVVDNGGNSYDITLDVVGATGVNYVSINSLTASSGTLTALSSSLPNGLGHNGAVMNFGADYGAWGNEFATQSVSDLPVVNGTVLSFTYTGSATELYVGDLAAAYFGVSKILGTDGTDTSFAALGLDVIPVPEPMTMALLGLGGLFIRRRRA